MAARRVAKSAVDWASFGAKVPAFQSHAFRALKARSDGFITRIHKYPESMPAIDWASYKAKIAAPGVVEALEQAYAAVEVPYPNDVNNVHATIDKAEEADLVRAEEYTQYITKAVDEATQLLTMLENIPPPGVMTKQMAADYFPEQRRDPDYPTIWPHRYQDQPGNDPESPEVGLPEWLPRPGFRPDLSIRNWEPMTHEEEYAVFEYKKTTEAVEAMTAKVAEDPALQPKLDALQAKLDSVKADIQRMNAIKKKNEADLDAWRAAGCP